MAKHLLKCSYYIYVFCVCTDQFKICSSVCSGVRPQSRSSSSVLALSRSATICSPVWRVSQIWGIAETCEFQQPSKQASRVKWCAALPVMMSSRAPSLPSRTWGFTCLFFSSAIRSIWGILGIAGPWNKITLFRRKILFPKFKAVSQRLSFCICEPSIIAVKIPFVPQPCLETVMTEVPLGSGSPFSSSVQALAALSAFNKSTCCNDHIKNNESASNPPTHPPTHLIGLYEAAKYREKHGRLCGFGILPKILHRRTVGLLNRATRKRETTELTTVLTWFQVAD